MIGQLLLLERLPFCPARSCPREKCGPGDCECKPCRCGCRGKRIRGVLAAPTPDLTALFAQRPVQPSLFANPPALRRSRP